MADTEADYSFHAARRRIKSPNRKSPKIPSPNTNAKCAEAAEKTQFLTPERFSVATHSSTRLDDKEKSTIQNSKSGSTLNVSRNMQQIKNNSLTPTTSNNNTPTGSAHSSPRSYQSSLHSNSPRSNHNFNNSNNSSEIRRNNCSPVSDCSSSKYVSAGCGVPQRTCSTASSVASSSVTAHGGPRSCSRSSNHSEFSHHDGKAIPLKVNILIL